MIQNIIKNIISYQKGTAVAIPEATKSIEQTNTTMSCLASVVTDMYFEIDNNCIDHIIVNKLLLSPVLT